jgi:tetratricopeptide (TPR) repeat protein
MSQKRAAWGFRMVLSLARSMARQRVVSRLFGRLAIFALVATAIAVAPAAAQTTDELENHLCFGEDHAKHVDACTELLDQPGIGPGVRSSAYAMRALGQSLLGKYAEAIADYDSAIQLNPSFAVALNNRAWAFFKWGKPTQGLTDVERSLALDSMSAHSYDTRAHIMQASGNTGAAMADYDRAMFLGGLKMVKLYQCGLAAAGLYKGQADGRTSPELRAAFLQCVASLTCDPLPPDEDCRAATS